MKLFDNRGPDTGEPILTKRQMQWVICDTCRGEGKRDNPAFANGITSEEWANDWDEDEREGYLEGRYDVPCNDCNGAGRQQIPLISACTFAQKRILAGMRKSDREYQRDYDSEKYLRMAENGVGHGCGY